MKVKGILSLILTATLVLSACANTAPPSPNSGGNTTSPGTESNQTSNVSGDTPAGAESGRDIVIALNNNLITLDPHAGRDALSNNVIAHIMEGLVHADHTLTMQPSLAESWDISPDAKTFTFHLRQGVKFTDGTDFNAEAVRVNVERVWGSELRAARTFNQLESMEVTDEYTIVFNLSEPFSPFLNRLEAFRIVSPKSISENAAGIEKAPVGTGPYIFREWIEGDRMVMDRNPDWRDADKIQVDSITYRFIMENGTRVAMLQAGEADLIYPMPSESLSLIQNNAGIEVEVKDSTVVRYVTMNQNVVPLNDVRVRQAMNHAVDKDAFIAVVRGGFANYLNSSMSPLLPYYAEQEMYEYNLERARELMAEAGYPDGFTVTLWGNTESETLRGMDFLAQQLGQIGITVDVVPMEEGTLSESVYNTTPETTELQMWYVSWSATDPDNALRSTFLSSMVPPAGANTNYYNNPEVDAAILAGNMATTFEEQFANYARAQDLIWEDAVWMFLGVDRTVMAKNADLLGARLGPSGSFLDLREISIR